MTSEQRAANSHALLPEKIASRHRERLAIVYLRQSTPQQLKRHQESTRLQYALADLAVDLGWQRERVIIVNDDLGLTGSTIECRLGFQRVMTEVGLGNVGIVLGIEVSRLARSCRDWHQLLEMCGLFDTLSADADRVYDPAHFNDRLLLGLKDAMSEAELHVLKARMLEARLAKARRGELGRAVPMGYVRRATGEIAIDPDEQAQATIRLIFDLYDQHHTIGKVLRHLTTNGIKLPIRLQGGAKKGELEWRRPSRPTLYCLLVNPIYAGAYVYGMRPTDRRRQTPGHPRTGRRAPDLENAHVVLHDHVPAYISWARYQDNREQLRLNAAKQTGSVRAGSALLSGLLTCGRCGLRMNSAYNNNGGRPRYLCNKMRTDYDEPACQTLAAAPLDEVISRLVLEALQPAALDVTLAVAADVQAERLAMERHWQQRLERARYQTERAQRQYHACEPENRLVARTLERDWEKALTEQTRLEAEHERSLRERPTASSPEELAAIRAMGDDLPAQWRAGTTTQEDRQNIIRLLLERVIVEVIGESEQVRVECHWRGGVRTQHQMVRPISNSKRLSTYPTLIARVSELREAGHSGEEIAKIVNCEGWRAAQSSGPFTGSSVRNLLRKAQPDGGRLRRPKIERGPDEWTVPELANHLGVPPSTIYGWVYCGRLRSRIISETSRPRKLVHADAGTIAQLVQPARSQ